MSDNTSLQTEERLNPEQLEAVRTTEGPLMVIAGPGSGKTRVIIHRAARLINELRVPASRIMAVTFTNKAAAELADRLREAVQPHIAATAQVSNFHRFCGQLNRRYSTTIGLNNRYSIYDHDDQLSVTRRAMEMAGISPTNSGIRPSDILSSISRAKSLLVTPQTCEEWLHRHRPGPNELDEAMLRTYPHYQRLLELSNALDFDDIISRAIKILTESKQTQNLMHLQYQYIMVDEYQDTDHAQHRLMELITGPRRNICIVGDPDQSIYGWRNARIANMLEFPQQYPEAAVIRLGRNYRSTGNIVQAAESLIARNRTRTHNPLSAAAPKGPQIRLAAADTAQDEASWTVNVIADLRKEHQYRWEDLAILYRTSAQSRAFEEACIRRGVPYRLVGGTRFYHRREIKDLLAYLRVLVNPGDDISLQRIINLPPRSIGANSVRQTMEFADSRNLTLMQSVRAVTTQSPNEEPSLPPRPAASMKGFIGLIDHLTRAAASMSLTQLFDLVLETTGLDEYIKGEEDGNERWDNILELRATTNQPEYSQKTAQHALQPFLEHASLFSDTDEYENNSNSLTLMTLHQAKGLEFGAVAMPGMIDGILPHARAEDIEEERRLCYVGITRAKTHLLMSWAATSNTYGRLQPNVPSRFLSEIPHDLTDAASQPADFPWEEYTGAVYDDETDLRKQNHRGNP